MCVQVFLKGFWPIRGRRTYHEFCVVQRHSARTFAPFIRRIREKDKKKNIGWLAMRSQRVHLSYGDKMYLNKCVKSRVTATLTPSVLAAVPFLVVRRRRL